MYTTKCRLTPKTQNGLAANPTKFALFASQLCIAFFFSSSPHVNTSSIVELLKSISAIEAQVWDSKALYYHLQSLLGHDIGCTSWNLSWHILFHPAPDWVSFEIARMDVEKTIRGIKPLDGQVLPIRTVQETRPQEEFGMAYNIVLFLRHHD